MGGLDIPENIMLLTRREHGIAHLILNKLYGHDEDLWAANILLEDETLDVSGDKNPMARQDIKEKHSKAMKTAKLKIAETMRSKTKEEWASAKAKEWETRKEMYGPSGRPDNSMRVDAGNKAWQTRLDRGTNNSGWTSDMVKKGWETRRKKYGPTGRNK